MEENKLNIKEETYTLQRDLKLEAERKPNKYTNLLLLVFSIVAFYLAGVFSSDPVDLVILMGVLLFHELGHLFAMKVFGYGDLKVFFIPFLGAIASGNNVSSSQIKKAIISMMGPIPGIILGIVLFEYLQEKSRHIVQAIYMLLFVNAFNLLPLYPLDGGRVVSEIFSRNIIVRSVFSIISAVGFFSIAIYFQEYVLIALATLTFFNLYSFIQYNKISNLAELSNFDLKNASKILELPIEKLETVFVYLKKGFESAFVPKIRPKIIYQHLENLAELNNHTPSKFIARFSIFIFYILTLGITVWYIAIISVNLKVHN